MVGSFHDDFFAQNRYAVLKIYFAKMHFNWTS